MKKSIKTATPKKPKVSIDTKLGSEKKSSSKKRRSGRKSIESKNIKSSSPEFDVNDKKANEENNAPIPVLNETASNSALSSLNSSGTLDSFNKAMIESSVTDESDKSITEEKKERRRSRRSSLKKSLPTPSIAQSPEQNENENPISKEDDQMMVLETKKAVQKSPRPNIKATTAIVPEGTPTISLSSPAPAKQNDPYDFAVSPEAAVFGKSTKNYRRRSSGSTSSKKANLLVGSPRAPTAIPLHATMEDLKRKSIPLVEDTVEVENNSSPIKKPPSWILKSNKTPSSILFQDSPVSTRKSRRVSFGPQLSPEQFLKTLPPNTPVKKGAVIPTGSEKSLLGRKSVSFCPPSTLETLEEQPAEETTPVAQRKVSRTPTPFKPAQDKKKQKSLLQHVLTATANANSVIASPQVKSLDPDSKEEEENNEKCFEEMEESPVIEEPPVPVKSPKKRRSSLRNTPIVNTHKTATNLFRRRSAGKMNKPLWSEIVRKDMKAAVISTVTSQAVVKNTKKVSKKKGTPSHHTMHHVDSPATIYIGRTKSRVQPTRTPRPPKGARPVKLDLPLNESFGGLEEIFRTPAREETSLDDEDHDLYDDLHTPEASMAVSPFSVDQSKRSSSRSMTRRSDEIKMMDSGASPDLRRVKISKCEEEEEEDSDDEISFTGIANLFKENDEESSNDEEEEQSEEMDVGDEVLSSSVDDVVKRVEEDSEGDVSSIEDSIVGEDGSLDDTVELTEEESADDNVSIKEEDTDDDKTEDAPASANSSEEGDLPRTELRSVRPKREKYGAVEENFGTKRLLKTPKQKVKSAAVSEHFGTKRLLKTPREKKTNQEVTDKLGMKRLLQTPKEKVKNEAVEENLGTKRLLKTPRAKKNEAVSDKFGTKRLLQTPKEKQKIEPVAENFGTKRLLKTPKVKQAPVLDKFGTKRIFTTPVQHAPEPAVVGKFGFTRIFKEDEVVEKKKEEYEDQGLDGLRHIVRTPKMKNPPQDGDLHLAKIMSSPEDWRQELKKDVPTSSDDVVEVTGRKTRSKKGKTVAKSEKKKVPKIVLSTPVDEEETVPVVYIKEPAVVVNMEDILDLKTSGENKKVTNKGRAKAAARVTRSRSKDLTTTDEEANSAPNDVIAPEARSEEEKETSSQIKKTRKTTSASKKATKPTRVTRARKRNVVEVDSATCVITQENEAPVEKSAKPAEQDTDNQEESSPSKAIVEDIVDVKTSQENKKVTNKAKAKPATRAMRSRRKDVTPTEDEASSVPNGIIAPETMSEEQKEPSPKIQKTTTSKKSTKTKHVTWAQCDKDETSASESEAPIEKCHVPINQDPAPEDKQISLEPAKEPSTGRSTRKRKQKVPDEPPVAKKSSRTESLTDTEQVKETKTTRNKGKPNEAKENVKTPASTTTKTRTKKTKTLPTETEKEAAPVLRRSSRKRV
nr:proliferation marker protein Ki-67-like isoform X2 [Ciona intestinalis]|eukprot:XP_018673001.1 proliferation marker protein Ki-67-like isoform X2 [Ciona intestinalis]